MNDPAPSDWHRRDTHDVAQAHDVELHRGLPDDEAARRAGLHGPNALAEAGRISYWRLLLQQFTDFMIVVLAIAALAAAEILVHVGRREVTVSERPVTKQPGAVIAD